MSTLRFVDASVCRRFGLSTFWSVEVSVCRRFGLSTFWVVEMSVRRPFGLSTFWFVCISVVDVSICRPEHVNGTWLLVQGSFYGTLGTYVPVHPLMVPWVPGLFGT